MHKHLLKRGLVNSWGVSIICLLILLVLFQAEETFAQDRNIEFNHLTQQDGLSQSTGQVIYQDSDGFMWFGTNDGLNRYNGYQMTVFKHDPEDSTTISSNNVSEIYEDNEGVLWVGTSGGGLNKFDKETQQFSHYRVNYENREESISDYSITSIVERENGEFWIGTYNGLNRFDRDSEEFFHFYTDPDDPESLSNSYINCVYEDSQENLWIGTNEGLNLWNSETETFKVFKHDPADPSSISGNRVMQVYEDDGGTLWVGTGSGLNKFNRQTEAFQSYIHEDDDPYSISGNTIYSILEDSRGVLWVGTENNGLNQFDRNTGRFYHYQSNLDNPNSISDDAIYSLYENNDQILWIGTYSGGINFLDRKNPKFEHYKYESFSDYPLSNNSVTSFLKDSRGNMWVGTDGGGLNLFDQKTGRFYPIRHNPNNSNSLASDIVLALLEDHNQNIWIGYYNGGISRFNVADSTFEHYKHDPEDANSLCHNDVFALYEDKEHNIWVGTNGGGVCKLNPETGNFTQYSQEEGTIRDISIDPQDRVWMGTYGGGLKLLNREQNSIWNFYEGDQGLTSNIVLTIHVDQKDRFWIGTKEGGLHHFVFDWDHHEFTSFSVDEGLPNNQVKGILEDDSGNLWLSTNNGISKFNPSDTTFTNFHLEDGLQGQEFNDLSYYKDNEGYMYFGGNNGFNRFHPDSVRIDSFVHPLVLTDFKIFNESVTIGEDSPLQKNINHADQIKLSHTASIFSFEFASLNYNTIKGDTYAYMLEGFDSDWNQVGEDRSATYTNIDPGEYTFRVKSANSDGIWNTEEASIKLVITPPFWRTTWFYLLSALFVSGLIFGGYRYRMRIVRRQNKLLARKVAERTSQLDQKNKELQETLEDLSSMRSELIKKAHKAGMADLATGVLHNVGNILNSVNTSSDVIHETIHRSKINNFKKANQLLKDKKDNFEDFLLNDPRGKDLIQYYLKLEEPLDKEYEKIKEQAKRLKDKVNLISEVIEAQQDYAKVGRVNEEISLKEVTKDALKLQAGSIDRHNINVREDYNDTVKIPVQKSKFIHILINLFKNAKEAMEGMAPGEKNLFIRTWEDLEKVHLSITDNGDGIKKENLNSVFNHGFTTKEDGHGFGLHTCANYMTEMGGEIKAESEGKGEGTTFTVSFTRKSETENSS
ncbi:ATP-binding protein [Aliifodinibius salicampi]|uniref:histidine kinase n=1 Tax=Fodinibius salicampi TaxID=1920655 RepID=A0ABT3PVK3_9BACT|nr:sensor histidine kinase [Fodinibius salicampi]MCW9711861.1 ATP-binding protein [Fodinibius salicampi]